MGENYIKTLASDAFVELFAACEAVQDFYLELGAGPAINSNGNNGQFVARFLRRINYTSAP